MPVYSEKIIENGLQHCFWTDRETCLNKTSLGPIMYLKEKYWCSETV
jgi:hypothetical protein